MPEAKNRLRIRSIDTVGFVHKGDDPAAEIVFWKRARGDEDMTDSETRNLLQKIYDAVTKKGGTTDTPSGDDEMAEFKKEDLPDEARAAFTALEQQVADLQAQIEAAEPDEPEEPADVLKALPDEVREAIEKRVAEAEQKITKAEERAQKAEEAAAIEKRERRLAEFRKTAESKLVNIQGSPDEKADLLLAIEEHLSDEQADQVNAALAAASEQLGKNAVLLGEIGKHGGDVDPDSPQARIEALAKARKEADPALTYEQAYAKVLEDPANRNLVAESRRRQ